MFIGQFV